MSSHTSTHKAILYALTANLAVTIAKSIAAFFTGSSSMLAEAIHSLSDCGNQVLLYVGMRRSELPANDKHPMGYGRESYFWSMTVALMLFLLGGIFSVYEGIHRYLHPEPVAYIWVALGIITFSMIAESMSFIGALSSIKSEVKNIRSTKHLWKWFKETHANELIVVIGEDLAALLGLAIAFVMTSLVLITGNPLFDAMGSILIGLMLILISFSIAKEIHSLLIGEADIELSKQIKELLYEHNDVKHVFNIMAINHGNRVMLAIKAQLTDSLYVFEANDIINDIEVDIKTKFNRVGWVFFEIDNQDTDVVRNLN